ncbi:MAG: hypothetical protein ACHQ51_10060 [Elusimicrobiota bacterium]
MNKHSARRLVATGAAAAAGALYLLAARATPVGAAEDDALHILLARSLRHGAFAFPDGTPANDPLPGFAALLSLPAAAVAPHWDLLKIIGLLSAAATVYLTWRLARRFLDEGWALAAAALVALNPLTVTHAGLILPDLPYLALSLFLFDRMLEPGFAGAPLIAAAAAASLLRPFGAWLILSLALGIAAAKGARKALAFALPALLPLALWSLRNRLLTGAASGYFLNMRAESAALAEPRIALLHAGGLLAAMGGDGLLSLGNLLPLKGLIAAGAACGALAVIGAVRVLRRKPDPRAFAIGAYAIIVSAQHLVWMPLEARYVLPLLPLAWIMILAELAPRLRGKNAPALLFALLALPAVPLDLALAAPGLTQTARFQPGTMSWLRENTPPGARVQTLEPQTVTLLSGRAADLPGFDSAARDAWLAWTLRQRFDYVHVAATFVPGGFFSPAMGFTASHLGPWARSTPYAREVFRNDAEGTSVFLIRHPDPERYLKAWSAFVSASVTLRRGGTAAAARADLDRAIALEPGLALAWAYRGLLTADPRERRRLLEKAAALDPTSELIRNELTGASGSPKQPVSSLLRSPL